MTLTHEQLEWIVQEVVRRLLAELGRDRQAAVGGPADASATLALDQPVVTALELRPRLAGVARLEVGPRTIVTPAARDLLKETGVALARRGVAEAAGVRR
jgi:hypothetical protein